MWTGCTWLQLDRPSLVVITLKVESNVGLNVATKRVHHQSSERQGEILEFLESLTITFAR